MGERVGFYTGATEDSFRTLDTLQRERILPSTEGLVIPTPRSLQEWTEVLVRRQQERQEVLPLSNRVTINFDTQQPIAIAHIGDLHALGDTVDYERAQKDIEAIRDTPGMYAMVYGDLVNNFYWAGSKNDDLGNFEEEALFAEAVFGELKGKMLCAWMGNHEQWSEKTGTTLYHRFIERTGVPLFNGISYVTLNVGEQEYKLAGSHQFGGFSIYNNAHSPRRAYNDEAQGADICVTGHTHRKGYLMQPMKVFDGQKPVHFISLGAYKAGDSYSRKRGWSDATEAGMGGFVTVLYPDEKRIQVYDDIEYGATVYEGNN